MEVTLEKIELVKDRTGVTYKEAKEALEACDGSVVDAIIHIEENIDSKKRGFSGQGSNVVDAVKSLVRKGNVSKVVVKNCHEQVLVNIPVNVCVIGTVVAPWGMIAGAIASAGFKCTIEVVKVDGTIIDVSERAGQVFEKAREKGSEFADTAKEKGSEWAGVAKEKGSEWAGVAKEKGSELAGAAKDKGSELADSAKEKGSELKNKVKENTKNEAE